MINNNNKKYKLTILGCGSSSGVPSIEDGYGKCDPNNPKNNRTRTSAFLEIYYNNSNSYKILFDCSPDFRSQALASNITHIDSIFFTHNHSDHIYGIGELRSINRLMHKAIDCYANLDTYNSIKEAFSYIFNNPVSINKVKENKSDTFYKPALNFQIIDFYQTITLNNDIKISTTQHTHGNLETLGYIIDNKIVYATDISFLSEKTLNSYKNMDVIVISAVTDGPHYAHMKLAEIIKTLEYLKPKKAYLIHMSTALDYQTIINSTPNFIKPAYDGLIIDF